MLLGGIKWGTRKQLWFLLPDLTQTQCKDVGFMKNNSVSDLEK